MTSTTLIRVSRTAAERLTRRAKTERRTVAALVDQWLGASEPHVVGMERPTVEHDPVGRFRQPVGRKSKPPQVGGAQLKGEAPSPLPPPRPEPETPQPVPEPPTTKPPKPVPPKGPSVLQMALLSGNFPKR